MKTKIFVCVAAIVLSHQSQAQLLKKLKDKVDKTINGSDNSASNTSNNQSKTSSITTSGDSEDTIGFAKLNIQIQATADKGDMKGRKHIFEDGYSSYDIKNNSIVPKVVVTSGDQPEEAAGYDGITYIFENSKLSQQGVKLSEQASSLIAEHDKWNWPFSAAINNDNGQLLQYSMGTNGQEAYINFIGKKFGPYTAVNGIATNKSKTKFFAVVTNMGKGDLVYYLISSTGDKVKLPGPGAGLMVNADFSKAAVAGFSTEDFHKSDIYFNDGTVTKNANMSMAEYTWLSVAGRNILSAGPSGGYINGKKVIDKAVTAGKFWCDASGTGWCYYTDNGHLKFSGGADVKDVSNPQQLAANGKTYLVWFQFIYTKDEMGGKILSDYKFCQKEF